MEKTKKENGSISNISNKEFSVRTYNAKIPISEYPDSWIPRFMKEPTKAKRLIVYLVDQCPLEREDPNNFLTNVYKRRVKMFELLDRMTDKELENVINGKKPDSS